MEYLGYALLAVAAYYLLLFTGILLVAGLALFVFFKIARKM